MAPQSLWTAALEIDAALHAEQRSVDAGVAVRLARGHRDDVRLVEVDLVGVEARAVEVELVEDAASAERKASVMTIAPRTKSSLWIDPSRMPRTTMSGIASTSLSAEH